MHTTIAVLSKFDFLHGYSISAVVVRTLAYDIPSFTSERFFVISLATTVKQAHVHILDFGTPIATGDDCSSMR